MLFFVVYLVELIICFLLQNTIFAKLNIGGIVPDLLIVLVVSIAYERGKVSGLFMGIIAGLLLDITHGTLLGVYALCYMFIGYLVGFLAKYYVKNDTVLPLCMLSLSEFTFMIYSYITGMLTHRRFEIFYYVKRIMLPKVLYTAIVGIILYKIFDYVFLRVITPSNEDE